MCDVMPWSFIGKAQIEPYILEAIEIAKKDAWNVAIRWAAENGTCKYDSIESHVSGEYCWDVNVNKQSILNGLIDD